MLNRIIICLNLKCICKISILLTVYDVSIENEILEHWCSKAQICSSCYVTFDVSDNHNQTDIPLNFRYRLYHSAGTFNLYLERVFNFVQYIDVLSRALKFYCSGDHLLVFFQIIYTGGIPRHQIFPGVKKNFFSTFFGWNNSIFYL